MDFNILLGRGDGTFIPVTPNTLTAYALPSFPGSVQARDFNGDGVDDFVVTGANAVLVRLNQSPFVASLTPTSGTIPVGGFCAVVVGLTREAPTGGALITLGSSDSGIAAPPPTVTVPAGETSATFIVAGFASGRAVISASLNNNTVSVPITVAPSVWSYVAMKGDTNGDGVVDIRDAVSVLRILSGLDTSS